MPRMTMSQLTYGIEKPSNLFEKLNSDAAKLTSNPHPHDVFNFFVTAAVLNEWVFKFYNGYRTVDQISIAKKKRDFNQLPVTSSTWISDQACLPNRHCDVRRHIMNAMCICWDTANASKHYQWVEKSAVKAIESAPIIGNYYQYFFTSREADLYIDYGGECYGLSQLRGIVLQFYKGLLEHVDSHDEVKNN
jgi:hypothetical protein